MNKGNHISVVSFEGKRMVIYDAFTTQVGMGCSS